MGDGKGSCHGIELQNVRNQGAVHSCQSHTRENGLSERFPISFSEELTTYCLGSRHTYTHICLLTEMSYIKTTLEVNGLSSLS